MRLKRFPFVLLLVLPLLLIAGSSFAQVKKDTLFLYNGELLIGELKEIIRGRATFDSDVLGLISIKTIKIRTAHTTIGTLQVLTIAKDRIYGTIEPSGSKDTIYITDGVSKTKLAINQINSTVAYRRNFFSQLDGNVSAGLSFAHSTSTGQFNLNGSVKHTSRLLITELTVNALGSIDSSGFSRDQETEQLGSYHYILNSNWFAEAALSHQTNKELSLAHRFQELIGGGNKFLAGQTIEAFALTGIAIAQEESLSGQSGKGNQMEIPVIIKLDYFKFAHPNMQITMTNAGYISLTQAKRYRYDGNISFSWELFSDFSFTTNLYGNYDSKPLDPGSGKIDYGLVMGLSYKF
ncbi:DUF481 domain-containing protein [Mucilaginibacter sp. McL0603]|uniref:DUF481 domain-containing protein n=1 Tax=Mucilaginibacter sp. McL0603 TaxID=3415670 RepID=UPI003CF97AFF